MVDNIKLYINDRLVEFTTEPNILWTYQATDMSNPTAVKIGFTKTIVLEGTPNNNDILGHYWDVERFLQNGTTSFYNSSKKVPFQLFQGDTLYEEGYMKLDSIKKEGSKISYNCTLYGGLGDFFQCLSSTDDGKEKKLSDLVYTENGGTDEFDFTINIDTVNNAWGVLRGTVNPNFESNKKWKHINFMPAYNGYPSDFDADKVVMNMNGTALRQSVKNSEDDEWYSAKNHWTIGTLPNEMTEWEMRDLRSYLQRPCIKMSSIINACCNPDNNGGYEVELDPDFFNDDNDYWSRTYLTLPMIQNLEYANQEQILTGATLSTRATTGESNGLMYQDLKFDIGEIQHNVSSIEVSASIEVHSGYNKSSYIWFWNWNGDSYHTGWDCRGSLFCQLIAVNGDTVVGASQVYNLTTPVRHNGKLYYGHNDVYPDSTGWDSQTGLRKMGDGTKYIPYMDQPIYNVLGTFNYNGFQKEGESSAATFTFRINDIGSTVTGLKMVYYWGATADKVKHFMSNYVFQDTYHDAWVSNEYAGQSVIASSHEMHLISHNVNAVLGESLGRTGTKVTKALLLNTESTPCDYLLSYCKMFGLHFTKEIGEQKIHIMTRKTFYDRGNVVDLNDMIDRSKEISINPVMFTTKWYEFLQEKDESALQKKYLTTKGVEYGEKILNTGYEFNVEKKNLLDGNCIRSGIECMEKSKWFSAYNNDSSLRPWMNLGLKYTLWFGDKSFETNAGSYGSTGTLMPLNEGQGLKYYDVFPKLQFHDEDNSPTDGNNVLVFYSGFKNVVSGRTNPLMYTLSDDNVYQTDLNDGTPCWLFTNQEVVNDKRLCYKLDRIPVFERYRTGQDSGTVQKSLDFGSAQELYIPNYSLTEDSNIFHNFWRTYLTDLFDVNTRSMTCYTRILDNPNQGWFRRFYWFDNAVWSLNKIVDWNPTSYGTTKCEFIKVQDISDYTSVSQLPTGEIEIEANVYQVPASGGTVTLTITTDAGVSWRLGVEGGSNVTLSSSAGTGTTSVTATFAANSEDFQVGAYFTATRNDNAYASRCYVNQLNAGYKTVTAVPGDIIVPASGGNVTIDFVWFNQGDSYIYDADWRTEADGGWDFDVDITTLRDQNKAILTFHPWTGDTVRHNYCTFCDYWHDACTSIGIDQLPASYSFQNSGQTQLLDTMYASGATFTELPYWVTMSASGESWDMAAEQNPSVERRTSKVRMELNGTYADFEVEQSAWEYDTDLGLFQVARINGSDDVPYSGGSIVLEVTSPDKAWTASTSDAFITLGSTGDTSSATFTVTFDNNSGNTSRYCVITFVDEKGNSITYSQTQAVYEAPPTPPTPTGDTNALVVMRINGSDLIPASGGTAVLQVSTQGEAWTASTTDTFITLSPTGNTTSGNMTVTFSANTGDSRYCSVDFVDAQGNELTWTQTQEAYVTPGSTEGVNPAYLVFDATGGTATTTVNISEGWQIVGYPSWVTYSPSAGTGTTTVTVTAIPYSGTEQRQGSLVVANMTTNQAYVVTCIQNPGEGEILAVSPSEIRFRASGGQATLTIIANTDWTIG